LANFDFAVSAIYVLAGEERVGPMTASEVLAAVNEGRFALGSLGWQEGMDGWKPLAEFLFDDSEEEAEVVAEGPGYVLTSAALRVRDEVFSLFQVSKATLEAEHTKRGSPLMWGIIFGVCTVIALAMPHRPETTNQWVLWGLSLGIFVLLSVRNLFNAFRPSGCFVAIHLADGDDRVLPMADGEAREAVDAIMETLAKSREVVVEEEERGEEEKEADAA
jgi:hypothetical protein